VIEKKGCYLAALRPSGDRHEGLWEFPGGKIEPGETPQECLQREIREELGIGIEVLGLLVTSRYADIELMAYKALWKSGNLHPRAHAALRWIEPARFREIEWCPADVAVADQIFSATIRAQDRNGQ
jgi:8-oxo-dGTP diphosphatase